MPLKLICCVSLPSATISSIPIYDYERPMRRLLLRLWKNIIPVGKSTCVGCDYSFRKSGNDDKCPFCNSDRSSKMNQEQVEEIMKRVEANDPASICLLANDYHHRLNTIQQDHTKAIELYARAADLGNNEAHYHLGDMYGDGGDLKKAKIHYEAAAMAGQELARNILGEMDLTNCEMERAVKHWTIAASTGSFEAMHCLKLCFEKGAVSNDEIKSVLAAYNNSCANMRSEARDAIIRAITI